ncbi:MAG: diaminopimelate epimerase [Bacteroidetes bacterium]|nr:diaminopimelate epimerase [Bacteroidota bacterium]
MNLVFYKYHGTGNDFIIIDNRAQKIKLNTKQIAHLCHRRFGVGADGLMLLKNKKGFDFEMIYYNSDGNESSFCGNGSRCIVAFAKDLGVIKKSEITFIATDGFHTAKITPSKSPTFVSIKMKDVKNVELLHNSTLSPLGRDREGWLLNTGSPHYVRFTEGVKSAEIISEAKRIRYSERFSKEGVNVNFAEKNGKEIFVRTYERGVEEETLSCGTGVTASALASSVKGISTAENSCKILTLGGELTVRFRRGKGNSFSDIWLEGPAAFVFKGNVEI